MHHTPLLYLWYSDIHAKSLNPHHILIERNEGANRDPVWLEGPRLQVGRGCSPRATGYKPIILVKKLILFEHHVLDWMDALQESSTLISSPRFEFECWRRERGREVSEWMRWIRMLPWIDFLGTPCQAWIIGPKCTDKNKNKNIKIWVLILVIWKILNIDWTLYYWGEI